MSRRTLKLLTGLGTLMLALIATAGAVLVLTGSVATQAVSDVAPTAPPTAASVKPAVTDDQIVDQVALKTGLSREDSAAAVTALLKTIEERLASGESVQLVGFGTFSIKTRAARTRLDPVTGDSVKIPAARVIGFKAGKALKDAVN